MREAAEDLILCGLPYLEKGRKKKSNEIGSLDLVIQCLNTLGASADTDDIFNIVNKDLAVAHMAGVQSLLGGGDHLFLGQ